MITASCSAMSDQSQHQIPNNTSAWYTRRSRGRRHPDHRFEWSRDVFAELVQQSWHQLWVRRSLWASG